MPTLIAFFFILRFPVLLCELVTPECLDPMFDNVYQDGDMLISAFLPIYTYQTTQHTGGADNIDVSLW